MCWVSWCLIDPSRWVTSGQVHSAAPRRRWIHLPCTARDFIIPPFLCLALPDAQRRAPENSASSTFAVICFLYTKIRGREQWFSHSSHTSLPFILTQEDRTCAKWTAHKWLWAALIMTGRAHSMKQRWGYQNKYESCCGGVGLGGVGRGHWQEWGLMLHVRATQACSKGCESVSHAVSSQLVPEVNTAVFCYFLLRSCK